MILDLVVQLISWGDLEILPYGLDVGLGGEKAVGFCWKVGGFNFWDFGGFDVLLKLVSLVDCFFRPGFRIVFVLSHCHFFFWLLLLLFLLLALSQQHGAHHRASPKLHVHQREPTRNADASDLQI